MTYDIWAETQPSSFESVTNQTGRSPLLDAKVMMVDDEPMMTDLVQVLLEDEGYTNFVAVNNPLDALRMLRTEGPSVLLLDLMMPQMSGFDLLEAIRADKATRYTPVIILTAATGADSKLRALQMGATDFLSKPVDGSELVLRVRNALAFFQYHNRILNYDTVTGLPNRHLFDRGIEDMLEHRHLTGGVIVLMDVNVAECRELRQSVDQSTADGFVSVVARRMNRFAHSDEFIPPLGTSIERAPRVARLGDDHFCMVFEGVKDSEQVENLARRVLTVLTEPVNLGFHEVVANPWIGISLAPANGNTADLLRQSAELAAVPARQLAVARYLFASPELNARSLERLTLGSQLRGAAERNELHLHYQPKLEINSGRILGAEALVRWEHPEQGLLQPGRFIGLAEELGLIGIIGEWVLVQACRDAGAWKAGGLGELKVAVNVSKAQFLPGLCPLIQSTLTETGLDPSQLIIEITESVLMDDAEAARQLMFDIKALGVTLSIDDFGTGYSSLAYLKRFPLDELKIDRSFVVDLPGAATDVALVHTIVDLGHRLGMSVIAEGVETPDQLNCLARLGCDNFQGFLFSKPIPMADFVDLVTRESARPLGK